jgi:hypothetical protein
MNNHQKITDLLLKSTLNDNQSNELLLLFGRSEDEDLLPVVDILTQDIAWANKIYQNYLEKKNAVDNSDDEKWHRIFNAEIETLEKLD